jgi:hypothetical protein
VHGERIGSGHHFGGDYDAIADHILHLQALCRTMIDAGWQCADALEFKLQRANQ